VAQRGNASAKPLDEVGGLTVSQEGRGVIVGIIERVLVALDALAHVFQLGEWRDC
jgi:hypothetical protein